VDSTWCLLETQLGITSTVLDCASGIDAGTGSGSVKGGCCDSGGSSPSGLPLAGFVGALLLWPRRRRRAR
jgi:hypothetical protein